MTPLPCSYGFSLFIAQVEEVDSSLPMIIIGAVVLVAGMAVAVVLIIRGKKYAKAK